MGYRGKRVRKKTKKQKGGVIFIALVVGIFIAAFARSRFLQEHFARNTTIDGADCSYSNIPEAIEIVAEALSNKTITLKFGETEYYFEGKDFGLGLSDSSELEEFLAEQQKSVTQAGKSYTIQNLLSVNEEMVRACLSEIDELKTSNMVKPQNAFIMVLPDGTLGIEDEILGNEIDFDEAVAMCTESLSAKSDTIDFNLIRNMPEVLSTDQALTENVNEVNSILSTVINFELPDETVVTLDREIMKDWVNVDDEGKYYVDDSNIQTFVEELNSTVQQTRYVVMFTPTGCDYQVAVPVKSSAVLSINIEAEKERIQEELAISGTHTRSPIYEKTIDLESTASYVEIDITRQQVWMYYEGECILDGAPCVTGNAGNHDTPPGVFYLTSKSRNATLRGWNDNGTRYASFVSFWMPFNGGIGMHDASWRHGVFGGELYKGNGSHGCVNMRYEDAQTVYEHITKSMPIIVYESIKEI